MHATVWVNIKNIMLTERQTQKATYYMIHLYQMSRKGKFIEKE